MDTPFEESMKKQPHFMNSYNNIMQHFFGKITVGITGISYVPEIAIINQPHSDHLPNLKYLNGRMKKANSEITIYIPDTANDELLVGTLKSYYKKLLKKEFDKTNPQAQLYKLNQEFDRIKLRICNSELNYDGIHIEFFPTKEPPSKKSSESVALSSLSKRFSDRVKVCLESANHEIAYLGEADRPPETIESILKKLDPKIGEVILTPLHPEYPEDITKRSVEERDAIRKEQTENYRFVPPKIADILTKLEIKNDIELPVSLDPCHAEGILTEPVEPVLIQTVACMEPVLFHEKNEEGVYLPDNTGYHYLARFIGNHYPLPPVPVQPE